MPIDSTTLSRHELRKIFKRNRGSQADLARELGITQQTLFGWFTRRCESQRIEAAVREMATKLEEAGK